VRIAGLGSDHLRLVDVDARHRMRPDALDAPSTADREAGRHARPRVATVGTTSSTAVDPLAEIGEVCRRHGVWLHVDAAYAGTAAVCPELRWIHDGVLLADSYACNPHKWLLTNFDCTAFYVADRQALVARCRSCRSTCATPRPSPGAVIDYRDWQIPLGRRFRALKLWFVLRPTAPRGCARTSAATSSSPPSSRGGSRTTGLRPRRARPSGSSASATAAATRHERTAHGALNDEGFLHLTAHRLDDA
jgi:glutamate/tyrosine decarboxylase-like PLP-dependent enzyme